MSDLDPDAAAFLASVAGAPRLQDGTPQQALAAHVASAARLSGPGPAVERVQGAELAGVPVRRYTPGGAYGHVVYVHGGGWVVGTLDTYDTLCRELAVAAAAEVVSVGYDLAPAARHPRQADQVLAVTEAVLEHAAARSERVAVAGDSAGGYLAALTAQRLAGAGTGIAAQALVYPVVSPALDTESAVENATGYYLETEGMRWYWAHYLGDGHETPLVAGPGLPPTYLLTAGRDPLRDEGRAYGDALEAAGVRVVRAEYPGQIHGFVRFTAVVSAARPAIGAIGEFLATQLR